MLKYYGIYTDTHNLHTSEYTFNFQTEHLLLIDQRHLQTEHLLLMARSHLQTEHLLLMARSHLAMPFWNSLALERSRRPRWYHTSACSYSPRRKSVSA